ncbi:MAG: hypothetical protein HY053_06690 [Proteobacteria bacterium]|nr:hypothetical protein [Pseudomonadota bacterium]
MAESDKPSGFFGNVVAEFKRLFHFDNPYKPYVAVPGSNKFLNERNGIEFHNAVRFALGDGIPSYKGERTSEYPEASIESLYHPAPAVRYGEAPQSVKVKTTLPAYDQGYAELTRYKTGKYKTGEHKPGESFFEETPTAKTIVQATGQDIKVTYNDLATGRVGAAVIGLDGKLNEPSGDSVAGAQAQIIATRVRQYLGPKQSQ